jgi:hypothetical protein
MHGDATAAMDAAMRALNEARDLLRERVPA